MKSVFETRWMLHACAALAVTVGLIIVPTRAPSAPTAVTCPTTSTGDADGDGFTDAQECAGIALADGTTFPSCAGRTFTSTFTRANCLDPNAKDLFVIVVPAAGSLLTAFDSARNTFVPAVPCVDVPGVTNVSPCFSPYTVRGGFSALGVTVHQITAQQATLDRIVTGGSLQKAARVTESLDTSAKDLGYCNWGTPDALDGCTVWTQRIQNVISLNCTANTPAEQAQFFFDYTTHTFVHEAAHALGGLVAKNLYNASYGGYHYPTPSSSRTAPLLMEQYEYLKVSKGICSFNYGNGIALPVNANGTSGWNMTTDPPAVLLK
jgi:hypothetical protein